MLQVGKTQPTGPVFKKLICFSLWGAVQEAAVGFRGVKKPRKQYVVGLALALANVEKYWPDDWVCLHLSPLALGGTGIL